MRDYIFVIVYLVYFSNLQLIEGQLPDTESLRNVTHCDISSALNIACGTDEVIVLHSIKLAYNVLCETTCCNTYDSSDCFAGFDADITREFRRTCSGRQTCTVPTIQNTADFCSFGVKPVSYVFLQYYCIPGSRKMAICDTGKTLTSAGPPLYITSAIYPDVTIGSTSCACSIEVNSCSSSINLYEADIDLYLDTSNCLQNVVFKNGTDGVLTTIGCESYYTEYITNRAINSHYSKIDFINNSPANQEGLFLLGLKASEEGVSFSLSCSSVSETLCIGCGPLQNIANGTVVLKVKDDTSYGAIADVSCNIGYETNTPTISCQDNNTWPDAVCTEKADCTADQWRCTNGDCIAGSGRCDNIPDCSDASDEQNCAFSPGCLEGLESCLQTNGSYTCVKKSVGCCGPVPVIPNGAAVVSTNTTVANVECHNGYQESTPTIICLTSGDWEQATCTAVDCGPAPTVQSGNVTLDGTTTVGSTATVECETGYQPSKTKITCLASGQWEMPECKQKVSTTPAIGGKPKGNNEPDIILIVIIVILVAFFLVQLVVVTYFQCRIHNIRRRASAEIRLINLDINGTDEEAEMPKRILMVLAGCVPVLGIIAIYLSGRVFYRDVYRVSHSRPRTGNSNTAINNNNDFKNVPPDSKSIQMKPVEAKDSISQNKLNHESSEIHGDKENPVHVDHIDIEGNEGISYSNVLVDNKTQHQDSAVSNPTYASAPRQLPAMNGTMTRGISSNFDDQNNDMDTYVKKPKLPSIPQHSDRDHHHHHFSKEVENQRRQLQSVAENAKKQGKHVEFVRDQLYINNCLYNPENHNHHHEQKTVNFY